MKQSLTLKLGQQLTITPQLQQAIRLLQLSTADLQVEVQQAIESNPLLELVDDDLETAESQQELSAAIAEGLETRALDPSVDDPHCNFADASDDHAGEADQLEYPGENLERSSAADSPGNDYEPEPTASADAGGDDQWSEFIPTELPVDSSWDDVFTSRAAPAISTGGDHRPEDSASDSLRERLHWQLNLVPLSATDQLIGAAIIDAIGDDGYLAESLQQLHADLAGQLAVGLDEVEVVLHQIQQFEPSGVAARDPRECLLIQLRQLANESNPVLHARAIKLVSSHLDLLAHHDYPQLMRRLHINEDALREVIAFIQTLNPHPGHQIDSGLADYVVPDILVRRLESRWVAELTPECAPRVRINPFYAGLAGEGVAGGTRADRRFLRENLQEARWFLKSLSSRNQTLLKVAGCIVEVQQDFFDHGPEAMKPLVLQDIAATLSMHESTISRVTSNKYMCTPRGVFDLKYFFSSHVSSSSGAEVSSTAIRALIRKFTTEENPCKPLSDSRIATILGDMDFHVARRTVAKYRESMAIPPSNERKRLL